jgi:hypothetical protein
MKRALGGALEEIIYQPRYEGVQSAIRMAR